MGTCLSIPRKSAYYESYTEKPSRFKPNRRRSSKKHAVITKPPDVHQNNLPVLPANGTALYPVYGGVNSKAESQTPSELLYNPNSYTPSSAPFQHPGPPSPIEIQAYPQVEVQPATSAGISKLEPQFWEIYPKRHSFRKIGSAGMSKIKDPFKIKYSPITSSSGTQPMAPVVPVSSIAVGGAGMSKAEPSYREQFQASYYPSFTIIDAEPQPQPQSQLQPPSPSIPLPIPTHEERKGSSGLSKTKVPHPPPHPPRPPILPSIPETPKFPDYLRPPGRMNISKPEPYNYPYPAYPSAPQYYTPPVPSWISSGKTPIPIPRKPVPSPWAIGGMANSKPAEKYPPPHRPFAHPSANQYSYPSGTGNGRPEQVNYAPQPFAVGGPGRSKEKGVLGLVYNAGKERAKAKKRIRRYKKKRSVEFQHGGGVEDGIDDSGQDGGGYDAGDCGAATAYSAGDHSGGGGGAVCI